MRQGILQYCVLLTILFFNVFIQSAEHERSLVVILCTRNVSEWIEKTLSSIYQQDYTNYHVICIDDASTDDTANKIKRFIHEHDWHEKCTFIANERRVRKLVNLYNAVHMCADTDIIVQLDGDDWFANDQVLRIVNERYEDPDIWMTYGQYKNIPKHIAQRYGFSELGYARQLPQRVINARNYRRSQWVFMHMRTFYAWLFKAIRVEDLICENVKNYVGNFYPVSNDLATMFPIAEMCGKRFKFYNEVLYIRNLYPSNVGFKIESRLQVMCSREICRKIKYPIAEVPLIRNVEQYCDKQVDAIICMKTKDNVHMYIENAKAHIDGIDTMYVLLPTNDFNQTQEVIKYDHDVYALYYISSDNQDLKRALEQVGKHSKSEHVLLLDESFCFDKIISCGDMMCWLERTYAHAVHINMSGSTRNKSFLSIEITNDISVCKYKVAQNKWKACNLLQGTLLRTSDFIRTVTRWQTGTANGLYDPAMAKSKKVGIFYS